MTAVIHIIVAKHDGILIHTTRWNAWCLCYSEMIQRFCTDVKLSFQIVFTVDLFVL